MEQDSASKEYAYVGFWIRFLAVWIDTILLSLVLYPLVAFLVHVGLIRTPGVSMAISLDLSELLANWAKYEMSKGWINLAVSWALPIMAVIVFWRFKSATPGKMVFGARIVDAKTFGPPSTGQCIIRYLGYYVSVMPLCAGFILAAFDPRKQALHDKLAGTVVIRPRPKDVSSLATPPPLPREATSETSGRPASAGTGPDPSTSP